VASKAFQTEQDAMTNAVTLFHALAKLTGLRQLRMSDQYSAPDRLLCSSMSALKQLTCFAATCIGAAALQQLPPQLKDLRVSHLERDGPVDMSHLTSGEDPGHLDPWSGIICI